MNTSRLVLGAVFGLALASGCSGFSSNPRPTPQMGMPTSISPALIPPAPMAHTAILPASVMAVKPQSAIQGANWTQIPGAASSAATAPDGSLWVLSTGPIGPDKYIWHYSGGSWTNISGLASRLSVAPNGTLYAINSGGGTYAYSGGVWTGIGGGASDITVAADGSFYVLSNGNAAGSDQAIWHHVSGTWSQVPGSGTKIATSWDTNSYALSGGTVSAFGLYILNSIGNIYHENTDNSFVQLPGNASAVAPTNIGGIFVLGYPTNSGGNSIYYYDLTTPGWSVQAGSGVSISTGGSNLFVIGATGGIYSSPVRATSPTATFTPRTSSTGRTLSSYSIQSNPAGLAITVTGPTPPPTSCNGVTPKLCTLNFSNTSYQISIAPTNGNLTFTYTTDQTANADHTVYYNQNADTNGSIGSVSATSATRSPLSVTPEDLRGTPRFAPERHAGRAVYSSSRVAVHYLASGLQMGGRHAQDVERSEGVQRGVDVGFNRAGQVTRIVNVPSGTSVASLVSRLESHAEVASAEALQLRYKTSVSPVTPNDTHYTGNVQWDMFRIFANYAWAYTTGTPQTVNVVLNSTTYTCTPIGGIAIAIIDTGADIGHQDLAGKFTCGERVIGGTISYGPAAAQDTDGHGTNVSGIAAANTNNGFGFAGVGYNVSLQIYKIFPDGPNPSADTGDEAQAIYDAVSRGVRVISMSLGGSQSNGFDPVERDAVEYAISQNVVVVAAAGNETATTLDFPAGYDGVISVGATSLDDSANPKTYANPPGDPDVIASYSNSGPRLTLVAPGGDPPACETSGTPHCAGYTGIDVLHWIENIYTRTPFDPTQSCSNINDCRALFAGTSQATPHVAGAVALLLSKNPNLMVAQVTQILESTADDIGDSRQGHGRLNLYRAMAVVAGDSTIAPLSALPTNLNFVAFAYTNSGGTVPTIIDQTYTKGVPVASDGTFRIADILSTAGTYHCAVWADVNGDGKVDTGDWFGVATGTGTGSTPCTSVMGIVAHPVSAGFSLP